MSQKTFNDRLKQVILLTIIIGLIFLLVKELTGLLPGLLGAVTLYIISRSWYFKLVYTKKWKKGWTAIAFILFYLIIIGIPVTLAITLVSPKINGALSNPQEILNSAKSTISAIEAKTGFKIISENSLSGAVNKVTAFIPKILNSTANLLANLGIMLFVLYYMLYNGANIERYLNKAVPLKRKNIKLLSDETKKVVVSNAIGIPLISIIQGIIAMIGYMLFGVKDWALYGFLTGVCAFFPVVGTMIVWVPLVIYMFATGDTTNALFLTIYSIVVTGNVDYVARITLLKKIGDTPPVITILGVIVGLGLFGFVGLVFGPLLISYIIVLYEIYINEFVTDVNDDVAEGEAVPIEVKQGE